MLVEVKKAAPSTLKGHAPTSVRDASITRRYARDLVFPPEEQGRHSDQDAHCMNSSVDDSAEECLAGRLVGRMSLHLWIF